MAFDTTAFDRSRGFREIHRRTVQVTGAQLATGTISGTGNSISTFNFPTDTSFQENEHIVLGASVREITAGANDPTVTLTVVGSLGSIGNDTPVYRPAAAAAQTAGATTLEAVFNFGSGNAVTAQSAGLWEFEILTMPQRPE